MTSDYKNDIGIPDWRDAGAYPDEVALLAEWKEQGLHPNDSTLLTMWRWEFLRRREDYRQAWRDQYDESQAYWDECAKQGLEYCPGHSREAAYGMGARHLSDMADTYGLELVFAPWWRFRITIPPLFRQSFGFGYGTGCSDEKDPYGRHKVDARLESDSQMLIAFDLSNPLGEQLKRAQEHLEAIQSERFGAPLKAPRHHRTKWQKYLRALDAREAEETFESIHQCIALSGLDTAEYDAQADRSNWAASGQQLWKQARDLMFRLTPKT